MAGGYAYDQSGQSYFFFLTVLLLVLLPFTYTTVKGGSDRHASRVPYPCAGWNKKAGEVTKTGSVLGGLSKKYILLSVGWLAFAFVLQRASGVQPDALLYDPYKILGIATGATEKEIKKHYRKLSIRLHPDKVQLVGNQTAEEANNLFIDIQKAYQSLTNEDVRHNLEMFGHPDGKQEFSQGIALPAWIVESRNVWWVMGVYALVLGVMLPYFVGRWWYGSRSRTKDGILNSTAATYFRNLKEETSFGQLLDILASSDEFIVSPDLVKTRKALSKAGVDEYARIASLVRESADGKQGWEGYSTWKTEKKRARVLIAAHMLRLPIQNSVLLRERHETVTIAMMLTTGLSSIALAHNWLSILIAILHLQQFLLQAVHPSASALLQLPHVAEDVVQAAKKQGVETVEQFGRLDAGDVDKILGQNGDAEKKETWEVARNWPVQEFESAKFQIVGEKIVTPGSIVSFTVKLRMTPPGKADKPLTNGVVSTSSSASIEPVQGDESTIEELIGRRDKVAEGIVPTPLAHAPHFPKNRKPTWYIFVGDHKLNRVFVQPQKFTDFGPSAVRTVRLSFQAPPGPGLYTFQAYVMSDSYVGTDIQKDMRMLVESPPDGTEAIAEEDEISEPDEDSLAGQMAMMKGQPVRKIDEDDDDTSGSEEEEDDDVETSDSDSD